MSIAFSRNSSAVAVRPEPLFDDTDMIGIGEMARRFDTTLRTLRFYESRGLLKPHRDGAHRYYDAKAQQQFKVIDEGRKLGFTLTEIAEILRTSRTTGELRLSVEKIMEQISHLESQRSQIDEAIGALRKRYWLMSEPEEESDE